MQIFDARSKQINIGDYVRYTGTGTVDKVSDFKIEDDIQWVKLEKEQLWYSPELLEILDSKDIKEKKNKGEKEIDIENIKDFRDELENMELDSNVAEGGG